MLTVNPRRAGCLTDHEAWELESRGLMNCDTTDGYERQVPAPIDRRRPALSAAVGGYLLLSAAHYY
eukprot:866999-Rhodomonas_salina.2